MERAALSACLEAHVVQVCSGLGRERLVANMELQRLVVRAPDDLEGSQGASGEAAGHSTNRQARKRHDILDNVRDWTLTLDAGTVDVVGGTILQMPAMGGHRVQMKPVK